MAKSFPNTGATVIDTIADLPAASAALEGVMMFQKDSNELKICNGSVWVSVIDTDTPGGLVFLSSQTFSSSTPAVNFNNVFTSAFDNYYIEWRIANVNNAGIQIRLRLNGVDAAGSNTYNKTMALATASSSAFQYEGTSTGSVDGYLGYHFSTTPPSCGTITVFNPAIAASTGLLTNYMREQVRGFGMTQHTTATAYDGFSVFASSGNMASGKITVYGCRNAI
jgi:hypothetical protein